MIILKSKVNNQLNWKEKLQEKSPFNPFLRSSQNFINSYFFNLLGLELKKRRFKKEENSFIDNSQIISYRDERITEVLVDFGQKIGINFNKSKTLNDIKIYDRVFKEKPISNLIGGMGYNNGLILFILFSHYQPKVTVESGVWRGFTTYLIDKAIPDDSIIYCFDVDLNKNEFHSKKANYVEKDITLFDELDLGTVDFAFFDDHISIYDRLKLCLKHKIKIIVVDDDVSFTQVHTDTEPPVPTASMIFNYDNIPKKFEWVSNGKPFSLDISNIDVDNIRNSFKYIAFPSLKEFTGFDNSSFTSLLLRK